jgi:hypothetical protein
MAQTIEAADAYIVAYCEPCDDWTDSDASRKQRLLNVAVRELSAKYPQYTIPDAAAFEFANALSIAFNDTNRQAQQGVKSSSDEIGTVTFDRVSDGDPVRFIPATALRLIAADPANVDLPALRTGKTPLYTTL